MWRRLGPLVLALGAVSLPARALEKYGARFPDEAEVGGQKVVLSGVGLCEVTVFSIKAFVAALYLEKKTTDAAAIIASDGPKRFVMHFFHDVSKGALAEQFGGGVERFLSEAAFKALAPRWAKFEAALPDVKEGQRLAIVYVPGKGTMVEVEGKSSAPIPGADFAQAFFASVVGEEPANEGLRDTLLGR